KIYNKYLNKIDKLDELKKEAAKGQYTKKQRAKLMRKEAEAAKAAEERKIKAGIFKENAKAFAGKAFHAVKSQTLKIVGAGGTAVIAPILLIMIIITLIALLFSWQNAFKIQLTDREVTAETEEEILDGYMQMIYDYMQIAEYNCYYTYGDYCDARYSWKDAELDFNDYYNEVLLPIIEEKKSELQAAYGPAIASASPDARAAIIEKMNQEIADFVKNTLEKGKEDFEEILRKLNDCFRDPKSHPPTIGRYFPDPNKSGSEMGDFHLICDYTNCTTENSEGDGNDAAQYAAQPISSNAFDLESLNFNTDLTCEDIFPYIALSRVISIMSDGSTDEDETTDEEPAVNVSGEITAQEINDFFEKTEFIQIEAHLEGYDCGCCRRTLEGDWENGWKWKYYCRENLSDDYRHKILTGKITVKTEEELLDAVMTAYGAEEAGLSENDCRSLIVTYQDYVKDTLGNTAHLIGKNDHSLGASYYLMHLQNVGPSTLGPWKFNTPLETDTDKEGEENIETSK
ncbi:MAG: hypothetical protein ACI4K7_03415, partial [Oscillospiraceae bacterium]